MTGSSGDKDNEDAITLCVRLYTLLLVAYPTDFRRAYGPQMAQAFRDWYRDARNGSARSLAVLWVITLGDLVANACAERIARVKAMLTYERNFLMTMSILPGGPGGAFRRLTILALDVVSGVVAFGALFSAAALTQSLAFHSVTGHAMEEINALEQLLISLLWLIVLVVLARRGQTPGQALLRLRWVDQDGRQAPWRPIGDLSFWGAALPLLLLTAPWLVEIVWDVVGSLLKTWVGWHIPLLSDMGTSSDGACYIVTAAVALALLMRARRQPARVMRVA
jgi:hypothetical protein